MSSIALKTKSTLIQYCAIETCRVGGMEREFCFHHKFKLHSIVCYKSKVFYFHILQCQKK